MKPPGLWSHISGSGVRGRECDKPKVEQCHEGCEHGTQTRQGLHLRLRSFEVGNVAPPKSIDKRATVDSPSLVETTLSLRAEAFKGTENST